MAKRSTKNRLGIRKFQIDDVGPNASGCAGRGIRTQDVVCFRRKRDIHSKDRNTGSLRRASQFRAPRQAASCSHLSDTGRGTARYVGSENTNGTLRGREAVT